MWGEPKIVFTQFTSQIWRSREKLHICTREKETLFLFKNGGSMNYLFGGGEWGGLSFKDFKSRLEVASVTRFPLFFGTIPLPSKAAPPHELTPLSQECLPCRSERCCCSNAPCIAFLFPLCSIQMHLLSHYPKLIVKYVKLIGSTMFLQLCLNVVCIDLDLIPPCAV